MNNDWPQTDLLSSVQVSADRSFGTADTRLYLQGGRTHLFTSTLILSADVLLGELLHPGEELEMLNEVQFRKVSNRELVLTASDTLSLLPRDDRPAIRSSWTTSQGRRLWVQGTATEARVKRAVPDPDITAALLAQIRLCSGNASRFSTQLGPLPQEFSDSPESCLARYAWLDFVLEGTRQRLAERFGDMRYHLGVVAGLYDLEFPPHDSLVGGCLLDYELSDGELSNGIHLSHCDFRRRNGGRPGRLTLAWIPLTEARDHRHSAETDDRSATTSVDD